MVYQNEWPVSIIMFGRSVINLAFDGEVQPTTASIVTCSILLYAYEYQFTKNYR